MTRRAIILVGCMVLGLGLTPVVAHGGGMAVGPRLRGFAVQPAFPPTSAFGSPGGFPFMAGQDNRVARFGDRRVVRPFPAFPVTSFLYVPSVPYALPTDVPSTVVAPVTYVSPTVYVSVPVAAVAPAPIAASPAPPPAPTVVEYATGRYELRGDGASSSYTWVWIPNPPPAAPASPPEAPASVSSASRSQVYRWTDDQGTQFLTNRLENIPERYRSRAEGQARLAAQQ